MASHVIPTLVCVVEPRNPPLPDGSDDGPGATIYLVNLKISHASWGTSVTVTYNGETRTFYRPEGYDPNSGQDWHAEWVTTWAQNEVTWTDFEGGDTPHSAKIPEPGTVECPVLNTTTTTTVLETTTTSTAPPPPPSEPPIDETVTAPPATSTTIVVGTVPVPATSTPPTLPATGSATEPLMGAGFGFLVVGLLTVLAARRNRGVVRW